MKNNEKISQEFVPSNLYQFKLKEKYKDTILNSDSFGVINGNFLDLISENLNSEFTKENMNNSDFLKVSFHHLILRRVYIEDQDYPDFLLNLLEIQSMKDLFNYYKLLIEKNDPEMYSDKFNLQILAYRLQSFDSKVQVLDVLYLTHVNDENFQIFNSEINYISRKKGEKKKDEENFNSLASNIMALKSNYFEFLDSFYSGLHIFKNKHTNEVKCFLATDRYFQEKSLRQIFVKPLYFIRKKLEEKQIPKREYIWFLCFIGKRYHQLREVGQSLKIFEETYFMRSLEWGENTNETMDSLNRIGCALLRKKNSKNIKEIFEKVHKIRKAILGETNNLNAISLYNLGIASLSSYNYVEACGYFTSAISIYNSIKKTYEIKLSDCYQALGTTMLKLKKYDESVKMLQNSLKINSFKMDETHFSLKYAHICNTLALAYNYKKEPINCYICLLKSFVIFNALKGERNEVHEYKNKMKKFREENKQLILIETGVLLKQKLRSVFKRNLILEDILICFIDKSQNGI